MSKYKIFRRELEIVEDIYNDITPFDDDWHNVYYETSKNIDYQNFHNDFKYYLEICAYGGDITELSIYKDDKEVDLKKYPNIVNKLEQATWKGFLKGEKEKKYIEKFNV